MDEKIKDLAPKIKEAIESSQNILLHNHPGPDGDSVGSALAWMHILKSLGKNVTVISGDNPVPNYLSFLPGFLEIETKTYLEIDPLQFDLFIINDSSDISRVTNKGEVVIPKNLKTIVIDHHATNTGFGDINLTVPSIATCEMLYDLFSELGFQLTEDIARCLFTGLYTDSGGFRYQLVTPNTFKVAGELVKLNPNFYKDLFTMNNNNEPFEITFEALALSSVEMEFSNRVAIASVGYKQFVKNNIPVDEVSGSLIASKLISVKGWEIGISLTEKEIGKTFVSMRTRDSKKYDLTKLALALGGGGHKAAAGASIERPIDEAKKILIKEIVKTYPELNE